MKFKIDSRELIFAGLITLSAHGLIAAAFAKGEDAAQQTDGSVCIAPGAFDAFSKGGATEEQYAAHMKNPERDLEVESVRFVQIDKLAPTKVTSSAYGRVRGIGIIGKHWVKISKRPDMQQPLQGFSFTFTDQGSNKLCLWYGSFYGSWRLQPEKHSVCHCK